MPSVEENLELWNDKSNWHRAGDEWSTPFGNTEALWWFVIYPRIHRFVPVVRTLEIAPGHGRWTQYLRQLCDHLIAVDLSPKCIEECKDRFSKFSNITYHVNDGRSLDAVADGSIDFAFSFDSLVHAEKDVIEAYVRQLGRKLTTNGVAFLHHSNIGHYSTMLGLLNRVPQPLKLRKIAFRFANLHVCGRATSMTAAAFRQICRTAGVSCISQELISWAHGRRMIDAISIFTRPESIWDKPNHVLENPNFRPRANEIKALSTLYAF